MGIEVYTSDQTDRAVLVCTTTGRPIPIHEFESGEDAERFLDWVKAQDIRDVRSLDADRLDEAHTLFCALPKCHECGERVINASVDRDDECESCRPECDVDGCDMRGTELLEDERSINRFCPEHAKQARRLRDDEDPPKDARRARRA